MTVVPVQLAVDAGVPGEVPEQLQFTGMAQIGAEPAALDGPLFECWPPA